MMTQKDPIVPHSSQYTVSNKSMHLLKPGCWLNDEIINAYVCLINKRNIKTAKFCRILCLNTWFMSLLEDELAKGTYSKQKLEKRVKRYIKTFNSLGKAADASISSLSDLSMLLIPVN